MEVRAVIIQDRPVPFDVDRGIRQAAELANRAIEGGAELVAFGETFLGGYPQWVDQAPGAALWDSPGTRALHGMLLLHAVSEADERLAVLQEISDRSGALISIGVNERVRASLFNSQFLFRPGAEQLVHRKLVPTTGERLVWGRGDGSTLGVHDAGWGRIGQLVCWEHWMPLARAAMHHAGEAVHIAAWPTIRDLYVLASRHYAFEGRCFVLAAGAVQDRSDMLDAWAALGGNEAGRDLLRSLPEGQIQSGGSVIISPFGEILAQAGSDCETIAATLDMRQVSEALCSLDTDGHYGRPDVFELHVDRRPKTGLVDLR